MADANDPPKPDFTAGVRLADLQDGMPLAGRAGEDDVIVVRRGEDVFAVGAHCTHYHGPLADGLGRRRHGPLSVASRLLQPADRRSRARTCPGSDRVLSR